VTGCQVSLTGTEKGGNTYRTQKSTKDRVALDYTLTRIVSVLTTKYMDDKSVGSIKWIAPY
jgi:hypothetical protein